MYATAKVYNMACPLCNSKGCHEDVVSIHISCKRRAKIQWLSKAHSP